jgi:two-component system sensor histidine kinase CreC
MKLGIRIFFCYLLIFIVCFSYPIGWILQNLRVRYLEGVEDPLVDQANILAAIVGQEIETRRFDPKKLYRAFDNVYSSPISATIYKFLKTSVDERIYITDKRGKVIFDSTDKKNIGADYSDWSDVRLTLEGQYGARTTLEDIEDPTSSVLYVAAPIRVKERIAGVLTVAKPTTNIKSFLEKAKPQIFKVSLFSAIAAILLSFIVSIWITRPIKRLTRYANDIRQGKRATFPKLDQTEIGEMGDAFEKMQEALEGKKYVEQYVHNLTHEIKSPLSAIRGAAELLREKMPPQQRDRFLTNIHNEANRIQKIIDRMLELSALENQKMLQKIERISFPSLVRTVLESKQPILSKKKLRLVNNIQEHILIKGDSFLLHQAISNLIQNAIDFSPAHGKIDLSGRIEEQEMKFTVDDNGSGIPDYAIEKVFDKFFSLHRPDSGKKSTGLGLNFVKEVVTLHNGEIKLENRPERGVRATLILPL